jgi:uncharacterized protein YjbJ (UPF0337 family)
VSWDGELDVRGARSGLRGYSVFVRIPEHQETDMGDGDVDDAKGRIKEAAGDLTDDKDLKNEGKVDRATGTVKDKVGDVSDAVKDKI